MRGDTVVCANYGGFTGGTNNQAELEAAIQGIRCWARISAGEKATLVADSQLVLGFATGQYSASKNVDRASELRRLYSQHCGGIRWVRGHCGEPANERVDSLAKRGKNEALLSAQ